MIGLPCEDILKREVDLVEPGVEADPAGRAGLEALGQNDATPLGCEHHDVHSLCHERGDEADPAAVTVVEMNVDECTLSSESGAQRR